MSIDDVSLLTGGSFENQKSDSTTDPKKLAGAAKQFEALMISQMMKSARESSGGGWLSDGDQTGEDTAMGMAEEQFAQAMASSGGLGLARMIVSKMSVSKVGTTNSDALPTSTPASIPLRMTK